MSELRLLIETRIFIHNMATVDRTGRTKMSSRKLD
jgi:hypothetical protein